MNCRLQSYFSILFDTIFDTFFSLLCHCGTLRNCGRGYANFYVCQQNRIGSWFELLFKYVISCNMYLKCLNCRWRPNQRHYSWKYQRSYEKNNSIGVVFLPFHYICVQLWKFRSTLFCNRNDRTTPTRIGKGWICNMIRTSKCMKIAWRNHLYIFNKKAQHFDLSAFGCLIFSKRMNCSWPFGFLYIYKGER